MYIRTLINAAASRTALALALAVLAAPAATYASVIYNLTLTATSDTDGTPLSTYNGTGTITLSSAPSATGQTDYSSAAVTFLVDGEPFSGTATSVQFQNGSFRNATFSEQIGSSPVRFDLQTTSGYVFYYDNELQDASGTITSALAAVPEPAMFPVLLLLLTGMCLYRARRRAVSHHAD